MSNLTSEQQLAVTKKGTNIIVSAGAGSGKTTVLKSRVLRELKEDKVNLSNLIILTFTKNAANEMKERIRKIILENAEVKDQAELVDTANITTFDSYANTLVKKYNYLLNINKDFKIVDSSIIKLEIEKIIDDIFENLYKEKNPYFTKMIKDLCVKDDKDIREAIINIYYKITSIIDRNNYLDNFIDIFYGDAKVSELYDKYTEIVFKIRDDICSLLDELNDETVNQDKLLINDSDTANFRYATSVDELIELVDFKLADARGNTYTDEGKVIKDKIKVLKDRLKGYLIDSKKDAIKKYMSTKDYAISIINILKEIDKKIMKYKHDNNAYEFNDIALLAIDLVKNNEEVRNEIKNNTYEIMIDEYQDTNDIQEEFIKYIENNNVYMVGDVKQSIYRFRNANPYIFKQKYDCYKNGINGFKIDLNKNFRSRSEVVNNINLIFDEIMTDDVGGANYKSEHEMVFGNTTYDDNVKNNNYDMEILTYDKSDEIKDEEIEIFAMANDIIKRIDNHEQVTYYKNDTMCTRDATYKDFVVLVDKSKNFELIKKIFEYKGIPTTIDKDISIREEDEIFILKNIINMLVHIKNNKYDVDFKHSFLSVARSYICSLNDDDIFKIFDSNDFTNNEVYQKCEYIALKMDTLANREILNLIIEEFDIINKLYLVGDIEERLAKLEYFVNTSNDLNNAGYDIYSLNDYFNNILKGDNDIKMSASVSSGNTVTIMTIHASKGLENTYVYLPFLESDFTRSSRYSKFYFSRNYGLVLPFYHEGYGNTFIYSLYKDTEYLEALSEKIRLFYVALTRAKEKLIMVLKNNDKKEAVDNVTYSDLTTIKSFSDMLYIIKNKLNKYIVEINVDALNITDDYNLIKPYDYKKHIKHVNTKINIKELNINSKVLESKHFSKALTSVIDKNLKTILDYGTRMHYIFEVYDFKNRKIDNYTLNVEEQECVDAFLNNEITKNIKDAKILKEHEIMFDSDGNNFHGFIDLLLEYDDHFDIIDYKLSNVDSLEYVKQLNGYKDYIVSKYHKKVNMYLYSIKKKKFKVVSDLEK